MNARSMTSKLKRFGECWTLPGSSTIYGVLSQDAGKLQLPLDTPLQPGTLLQRVVDGSAWLCQSTCNHGGLYLSAEVKKCSHLATVFRQPPATKDTFGRDTAVELQPVLENIPLHLVSRSAAPDPGQDRHKIKWSATFETSTVYEIHPADDLHCATARFRVLGVTELTTGILTISAISI